MRNYKAKNVASYIAKAKKDARPVLKELRKVIKSAVPGAEEKISWGMPFYKYYGLLAGFAAFKNHVSFGFATAFSNTERKILEKKGYKIGNKTMQIKFNQKVPAAAIKRVLKAKVKANKAKVQS